MGIFNIFKKKKQEISDEQIKLFWEALQDATEKADEVVPILLENSRPNNYDFGLCPSNPLCSTGLSGTNGYLGRLCTPNGEKFTWSGYSSIRTKVGNLEDVGEDVYTLYLNGEPYTKLYFVAYVGKSSEYPPAGLCFLDDNRDWDLERGAAEMGVSVNTYLKFKTMEEAVEKIKKNNITPLTFDDIIVSLASATVQLPKIIKMERKETIICNSDITQCDTILFSCFLVRAMCLNVAMSQSLAATFSQKYVKEITKQTLENYPTFMPFFERMFENRMSFYDRMIEKNQNGDNIVEELIEEFEIILKSDIINEGYSDFSETTPLPIFGISQDFEYSAQVRNFISNIPERLEPYLGRAKNYLANNNL